MYCTSMAGKQIRARGGVEFECPWTLTLFDDTSGVPGHATSTPNQSAMAHAVIILAHPLGIETPLTTQELKEGEVTQYCVRRATQHKTHWGDSSDATAWFHIGDSFFIYLVFKEDTIRFHSLVNGRYSLFKTRSKKHDKKMTRSTEHNCLM
jgi:hypothetical protein